jgi:hypothetical protein
MVVQLIKKFPALFEDPAAVACPEPNASCPHPLTPRLGLPSGLFPSGFQIKTVTAFVMYFS